MTVAKLGSSRSHNRGERQACWWQHNDLVELLAALRDHERASYGPSAPPTAALEWHRAFRDAEARAETWIRRLGCSVPGREHPDASTSDAWQRFIDGDMQSRALSDEPG